MPLLSILTAVHAGRKDLLAEAGASLADQKLLIPGTPEGTEIPCEHFCVNSRQRGLMGSFEHVKQSHRWCCGSLSGPWLLYFAAVQLWTAAGGGLPRASAGTRRRTLVSCWTKESTTSERVASGGRWPRHQSRSLRGDGDGDRLGDDLLLGDGLT
jgi:hypothetical protein